MAGDRFATRRQKLRKLLNKAGLPGLLVSNFVNVSYLTGFSGDDSWLILGAKPGDEVLVTDFRYLTQLEDECPGLRLEVRKTGVSMSAGAAKVLAVLKLHEAGFEANTLTVAARDQLGAAATEVTWKPTTGLIEQLREIKDPEEIQTLREAVRIAERGFAILRAQLRRDLSEKRIADELEYQMRQMGAMGCSFPPIIAAGARAALPHARATDQVVGDAELVLVDWGATYQHYRSDLTRVLATSRISPKLERVYGVVLKAQRAAIAAIRPGVTGGEVDAAARQVIADAGFGKAFGHSVGHGVGLDIHELPRLAVNSSAPLQPGMVVTVEPGIYLPGWGGVRIEDDVLVTRTGHEVLSSVPKELSEMVVA